MTPQPQKTNYEGSISELAKALISDLLKEAQDKQGDTPLDKIIFHIKFGGADAAMESISALSAYVHAKAAERQADAMESLAKTANKLQIAEQIDVVAGQAIVDERESKRDYLASTYTLKPDVLMLLWALRGLLVDASIRSLSRPDRFDPYGRLTTEEIAWSLRMTTEEFLRKLPRTEISGNIDFSLLEDFDIVHYSGTDAAPDEWMYGG